MAERKPLFMSTDGFSQEMAQADSMTLGGLTMGGNIAMGGFKVTGLADGSSATDAVTKQQLDAIAAGVSWKPPCHVLNMISDADQGGSPPGAPVTGDAYVVNNWGGGYNNGDIVEYSGTAWVVVVANSGAEPPNNTWVAVSATSATVPAGSFAGKDLNRAIYNSTTNAWTFTAPVEGDAFLVVGESSLYENQGYVYDSTTWVEFTGLAGIIAGDGLGKTGNTIYVKDGDGLKIDTDYVAVDLSASNPGLELTGTTPNKTLQVLVDGAHGIVRGATGLELELDDTPDTLDVDGDGLKVVGLPLLFKVNGTAVGATVTAANLDTVTNGSNADLLHSHAKIKKVASDHAVAEAITKYDPVYRSATNDRVGKARADNDAKSRVVGVSEETENVVGDPASIVAHGEILGGLSGGAAVAGTPYYLQATGGIGTAVPGAANRVILVGYAINATDLWVHILDYGKKV
jgi:hypothetical protein